MAQVVTTADTRKHSILETTAPRNFSLESGLYLATY